MSKIAGRHTTLDPEASRAVHWIEAQADVEKIILGPFMPKKHSKTPGTASVKRWTDTGLCITVFSGIGIREIHAHTKNPAKVEERVRQRWPEVQHRAKTQMEAAFEKAKPLSSIPPVPAANAGGKLVKPKANGEATDVTVAPAVVEAAKAEPKPEPKAAKTEPEVHKPDPAPFKAPGEISLADLMTLSGVEVKATQITPELAFEWLTRLNPNRQRTLDDKRVRVYAKDMTEGRWGFSESVIAFDTNGEIINGQHRLRAIVESYVTVPALVATGFKPEAIVYFDAGKSRDTATSYKIRYQEAVSKSAMSVARRLVGASWRERESMPRQEVFKSFETYRHGIEFATKLLPTRPFGTSSLVTVIARAYYAIPAAKHERIQQFCAILRTGLGVTEEGDNAAVTLRTWLMTTNTNGAAMQDEVYWKTERALDAFLKHQSLTRLQMPKGGKTPDELFPLPDGQ